MEAWSEDLQILFKHHAMYVLELMRCHSVVLGLLFILFLEAGCLLELGAP